MKFLFLVATSFWLIPNASGEDVVIIEEGNPIYKECMSKGYKPPGVTKYEAECTSEYYFPEDDMGDSPDPIEQSFTLKSNDTVCDLYRYGANIMWLPEWDSNPVDQRLALTLTDSLDPENDPAKANSTTIVDPRSSLPVTVIVRSEKAAARHLNCVIKKTH